MKDLTAPYNDKRYILKFIQAAIEAGRAILEVYGSDFKVEEKADQSPLTIADQRSHEIIVNHLAHFDIPVLSEEGKNNPYSERKKWRTFWLVDPLDGTKEFIKKNGEFTVNIAMICDNQPAMGVVLVPDKNVLYFASRDLGSFKADSSQIGLTADLNRSTDGEIAEALDGIMEKSTKLPNDDSSKHAFTIIGSRSHATPELEAFVEEKRQEYGDLEFISAGSSLKLCLVAEGKADIYPRLGPTMEWDTAAGQAIVENAGGKVYQYNTRVPLIYNKENLLNPWFVVIR